MTLDRTASGSTDPDERRDHDLVGERRAGYSRSQEENRSGTGSGTGASAGQKANDAAEDVSESTALDYGVRVGLLAYGLVHFVVAWVGVQLAFGDDSGTASSTGALSQLAAGTGGMILLWVMAAGFVILVVWRLLQAAVGHRAESGAKKLGKQATSLGKAVIYGSLAWSAAKVAAGGGSDGGQTDTLTAKVMAWPGGTLIVGAAGLAVIGYGLALVFRGISEGFADDLKAEGRTGDLGRAILLAGKVGYCAKGAALSLVGALFGWAALSQDPEKSGGLDQALHQLLLLPFGRPLLVVVAAGIACYGVFCVARSRHLTL